MYRFESPSLRNRTGHPGFRAKAPTENPPGLCYLNAAQKKRSRPTAGSAIPARPARAQKNPFPNLGRGPTHVKRRPADYFSAAGAASSAAAFSQAVESHFSQAVESQAAAGAAASTAVVSAASPSAAAFELALPQQLTIAAAARITTKVKIFFILFKSFKNASNIYIRRITSKFFRPILQNP